MKKVVKRRRCKGELHHTPFPPFFPLPSLSFCPHVYNDGARRVVPEERNAVQLQPVVRRGGISPLPLVHPMT